MEKEDLQEYWRWRLLRVMAEYIHEPTRLNTTKLNLFLNTYHYEYIKLTGAQGQPPSDQLEVLRQKAG